MIGIVGLRAVFEVGPSWVERKDILKEDQIIIIIIINTINTRPGGRIGHGGVYETGVRRGAGGVNGGAGRPVVVTQLWTFADVW